MPLDTLCKRWPRRAGFLLLLAATLMMLSASASAQTTMSLTGTPALGQFITVSFLEGETPVGSDFDLWGCPDTSFLPRDDQSDNQDCIGPFIRNQQESVSYYLDGSLRELCGLQLIVNDYSGGGHSNWLGPMDCSFETIPTLSEWAMITMATLMLLCVVGSRRRSNRGGIQ